MDFLTSLISVALLVALAIPAFILEKVHMIPKDGVKCLVVILLYVCQPMLTISSFINQSYDSSMLLSLGIVFVSSLIFHAIGYFVAKLFFIKAKKDKAKRVSIATSFLGNVGFMGIPLMLSLFPSNPEMILYTSIVIVGFNITAWTFGVYSITGNKKDISILKAFVNPPTLALIVALPLFFCNVYVPDKLVTFVHFLSDMTAPISMFILGIRLAKMPILSVVTEKYSYMVALIKLIIIPLITLGVMVGCSYFLPISKEIIATVYIIMAMPSASMGLSFAEMFNGDTQTAVKNTLITTVLSILTIPLLMLMLEIV